MKLLALTIGLAAVATAGPLSAQSRGSSDCRFERTVDASGNIVFLRAVGERNRRCKFRNREENSLFESSLDRQGNRIFVRRLRDANGRLTIQRVRRNPDGSLVVLSSRVVARERDDDGREFNRRDDDDDHGKKGRRGPGHDAAQGGNGKN